MRVGRQQDLHLAEKLLVALARHAGAAISFDHGHLDGHEVARYPAAWAAEALTKQLSSLLSPVGRWCIPLRLTLISALAGQLPCWAAWSVAWPELAAALERARQD